MTAKIDYEHSSLNKTWRAAGKGYNVGDSICNMLQKQYKVFNAGYGKTKYPEGIPVLNN